MNFTFKKFIAKFDDWLSAEQKKISLFSAKNNSKQDD
jgi:hypothetical protein